MKTFNMTITMNDELYQRIKKKYAYGDDNPVANCVWHGIDHLMFIGEIDELEVDGIEAIKMELPTPECKKAG